ncbi:hypothetical protein HDE_03024 [Halotydeus destructor]|nr:hypothetical protein HDE_03024 [Halotydeus destructor]
MSQIDTFDSDDENIYQQIPVTVSSSDTEPSSQENKQNGATTITGEKAVLSSDLDQSFKKRKEMPDVDAKSHKKMKSDTDLGNQEVDGSVVGDPIDDFEEFDDDDDDVCSKAYDSFLNQSALDISLNGSVNQGNATELPEDLVKVIDFEKEGFKNCKTNNPFKSVGLDKPLSLFKGLIDLKPDDVKVTGENDL